MMMIALAMLLPQLALAQNTEAKVKKIRQLYNEAQNTAQYKDSEEWMEHGAWSLKFESMINYAGGGPVKHRTEILLTSPYESDEPDNPRFNTVIPWLVRETIERSATIYREFLYDPQTEEFIFCYQRVAGYNEPKEQRLYFDKGRLIKAVPASMEVDFSKRNVNDKYKGIRFTATFTNTATCTGGGTKSANEGADKLADIR